MKRKLKTVIVDDERNAVDFIFSIIGEYCPELEVVGKAYDVPEGVNIINEKKPDLVFLDVEMPNGTGFDLLNAFTVIDFKVIFISAFDKNTIRAFRLSDVEYLLKPVNP